MRIFYDGLASNEKCCIFHLDVIFNMKIVERKVKTNQQDKKYMEFKIEYEIGEKNIKGRKVFPYEESPKNYDTYEDYLPLKGFIYSLYCLIAKAHWYGEYFLKSKTQYNPVEDYLYDVSIFDKESGILEGEEALSNIKSYLRTSYINF